MIKLWMLFFFLFLRGIDDIHSWKSWIALKVIDKLHICILIFCLQRNASFSSKQWSLWSWCIPNPPPKKQMFFKKSKFVMGGPKAFEFVFEIYTIVSIFIIWWCPTSSGYGNYGETLEVSLPHLRRCFIPRAFKGY